MWKGVSLFAMLLAGCVPARETQPQSCPIAKYQNLIGLPFDQAVFPLTLDHRVIAHDAAITMDHVPDRLNVYLDEARTVADLRCG